MNIKVATSQFVTVKDDFDSNLNKAIKLIEDAAKKNVDILLFCLLYTSPSPRDRQKSRMPSSA